MGLLSARWLSTAAPETVGTFTRSGAAQFLPEASPFLREMFATVLDTGYDLKQQWLLDDIADLLARIDVDKVFASQRETTAISQDPVIHFYEPFLAAYDKNLKNQRGVFFTPRPVVSYIVRSIHELLQKEFGLEDGLASTDTWGDVSRRIGGIMIPDGAKASDPFVCILDPATGTGTFLYECIEVIERTMKDRWCRELNATSWTDERVIGRWKEYVPSSLLPRLYGFELMMASYSVAHLKLSFKLGQTGYRFSSADRLNVYLTNTLEPPSANADAQAADLFATLATEARVVSGIKESKRFSVVVGNPPYSVSSWNTSSWITNLVEDYKRTVRAEESQIQALSNDYIKFLRFSQWVVDTSGAGVVGMITGHGYLQGTQPRDMRRELAAAFDMAYYLDLHGSVRRAGTHDDEDEAVFQIMTGVAVVIAIRKSQRDSEGERRGLTTQTSLTGNLAKKFSVLSETTAFNRQSPVSWHKPAPPYFYFAPSKTADNVAVEYHLFCDLPACFGTGNRQKDKEVYWATGFSSRQDDLAIAFTDDELTDSMRLLASSQSMEDLQALRSVCTTKHWNYDHAKAYAKSGAWRKQVVRVAYRPFDSRWTIGDKRIVTELRDQVMSQLGTSKRHVGLISSRAVNDLMFAHCFVTDMPVDKIFVSSKTSTNAYVFPLYIDSEDLYGKHSRHNFSGAFLGALADALGISKREKKTSLPEGVSAESIFNYFYAVLHSPGYRARYGEFLRQEFPRIPLPGSTALYRGLAGKGEELVGLHLLRSGSLKQDQPSFVGSSATVDRISFADGCVWIDKHQTTGFKGVTEQTWKFHVGGYQVCEKWLKDRKGRSLSKAEIGQYQRIVVSLRETLRVMESIDDEIGRYGGWPNAFQTNAGAS